MRVTGNQRPQHTWWLVREIITKNVNFQIRNQLTICPGETSWKFGDGLVLCFPAGMHIHESPASLMWKPPGFPDYSHLQLLYVGLLVEVLTYLALAVQPGNSEWCSFMGHRAEKNSSWQRDIQIYSDIFRYIQIYSDIFKSLPFGSERNQDWDQMSSF